MNHVTHSLSSADIGEKLVGWGSLFTPSPPSLHSVKWSTVNEYILALQQANLDLVEVALVTLFEDFHTAHNCSLYKII